VVLITRRATLCCHLWPRHTQTHSMVAEVHMTRTYKHTQRSCLGTHNTQFGTHNLGTHNTHYAANCGINKGIWCDYRSLNSSVQRFFIARTYTHKHTCTHTHKHLKVCLLLQQLHTHGLTHRHTLRHTYKHTHTRTHTHKPGNLPPASAPIHTRTHTNTKYALTDTQTWKFASRCSSSTASTSLARLAMLMT